MQTTNGWPSSGLDNVVVYVSLVGIQIAFAVLGVLTKDQLSKGTNPLVFVVYSNVFAALVLSPFAFFFEKGKRSALGFPLALRLVFLSLGGVCIVQALLLMGLKETSPSYLAAIRNLGPAMIFVMAWVFGMEKIDLKCALSRFKLVGTVISVFGAIVMSLLQGPALSQLFPSPQNSNPENILHSFSYERNSENRIKGCIYLISATIILSSSKILQAETLKTYPAPLSITAIISALGSFQVAILEIIIENDIHIKTWLLDWSGVLTIIYSGIVCHGIALALKLWFVQRRGPVFVEIFSPVNTVFSAVMSSFFFGETFHLGSVMGTLLIFNGLYMVLRGKAKEGPTHKEILADEEKKLQIQRVVVNIVHEGFPNVKIPLFHSS